MAQPFMRRIGFFFQAEDGIRAGHVTGVQTCALPISAEVIRSAKRPVLIAGGGAIYSEASEALASFTDATSIPVLDTQAGKGALSADHPLCIGGVGSTGNNAANELAAEADVVRSEEHTS